MAHLVRLAVDVVPLAALLAAGPAPITAAHVAVAVIWMAIVPMLPVLFVAAMAKTIAPVVAVMAPSTVAAVMEAAGRVDLSSGFVAGP